ncbi:hypothetical protein Sjap_023487 [Stephania japonica]|uniref:Uncharacterized protein n=1 Tax=Stephania japonica TaxID=461633 RepID=A0AAP0EBP5_9MAGN
MLGVYLTCLGLYVKLKCKTFFETLHYVITTNSLDDSFIVFKVRCLKVSFENVILIEFEPVIYALTQRYSTPKSGFTSVPK